MAILVLNDADIFIDTLEYSCVSNNVAVDTSVDEVDVTTFCSGGYKELVGGLKSFTANIDGYWTADGDANATPGFGTSVLFTVSPTGDATTSPTYFGQIQESSVSEGGSIGELMGMTINTAGSDGYGLVRGTTLATSAARTSSGSLSGYDYGSSPSSTQSIYAGVHVLGGSGTGGDTIKIYSSSTNVFTSETERFSWSAGSAMSNFATPITGVTHRYWRVKYALSASSTFVVVLAIV